MTPPLSQERLAEIRAAEQAATPGPWITDGPGPEMRRCEEDPEGDEEWRNHAAWVNTPDMVSTCEGDFLRTQDADFIALARTAVPELLAEVERLEEARGLTEGLRQAQWQRAEAAEYRVAELEKRNLDAKLAQGEERHWRERAEQAEAERDRLRAALESVLPEADKLRCRKLAQGEAVLGGDWDCCDWRQWHAQAEAALRGVEVQL